MASKFFLDKDRIAELRAHGLVPLSTPALRWIRIGAVSLFAALIPWNNLGLSILPALVIAIAPAVLILFVGLASTKMFLSGVPLSALKERYPAFRCLAGFITCIAAMVCCVAWLVSVPWVPGVVAYIRLLDHSPAPLAAALQTGLFWIALLCFVSGALHIAAEYLLFHHRHRITSEREG